ncbi:MAG: adenosine deaminase [Bryobacteraceae bacterium]
MEHAADYRAWPKAELHLHLEGSVDPETMQGLEPDLSPEDIRAMYHFTDFQGFLQTFKWVVERLRTPEDYAAITRGLLQRLTRDTVRYAEITISAGVVLWKGQEFGPVYSAIRQAAAEFPIEVRWILDAVRQFGPERAMEVAQLAVDRVDDGVIAFGIGGDEERGPAHWFRDIYAFARQSGLRLTAHAGETAGPASIWGALEIGAERIGHGIRAIDDPVLLRHLSDRRIPLEVCITSNVMTGAVESLERHPVRRLFDAGVPITLNTDDPGIFAVTLSGEFELAAARFGFSANELRAVASNAFRFAFASPAPAQD